MAEISKETRDAILRELSEKELRDELERRTIDPCEMKVKFFPPLRIERDSTCLRITMSSVDENQKAHTLLNTKECVELVRRVKDLMNLI